MQGLIQYFNYDMADNLIIIEVFCLVCLLLSVPYSFFKHVCKAHSNCDRKVFCWSAFLLTKVRGKDKISISKAPHHQAFRLNIWDAYCFSVSILLCPPPFLNISILAAFAIAFFFKKKKITNKIKIDK